MEIVNKFGLDPFLFGAQIINFLIILYLLKRFLYKPVLDLLKKREDTIKQGLKQAEEAKILLEKTQEREKEILRKAQEAAKKTVEEAKNQALLTRKQIEEDSKKQAERILEGARVQIEKESQETEKRLTARISQISIGFLEKALSQMFTQEEQKEVLEKALQQIKKAD